MLTIRKSSGLAVGDCAHRRGFASGAIEQRAPAVDRAVGASQQRCEFVDVTALDQRDVGVERHAASLGLGLDLRGERRDALGRDRDCEALLAGLGGELEHDIGGAVDAHEQRRGRRQSAVSDGGQ